MPDRVEFAKQILTISSHPDAFPGGVEPRIISLAVTLLAGRTGAIPAYAYHHSLAVVFPGVPAKTEVIVLFRAVRTMISS
jgi:hypothetical protein